MSLSCDVNKIQFCGEQLFDELNSIINGTYNNITNPNKMQNNTNKSSSGTGTGSSGNNADTFTSSEHVNTDNSKATIGIEQQEQVPLLEDEEQFNVESSHSTSNTFSIEKRGSINIKGKGHLETYWLVPPVYRRPLEEDQAMTSGSSDS